MSSRKIILGALILSFTAGFVSAGCQKKSDPPAAPPIVQVMEVLQRDVPVTREWVGTTDGMVNAVIRAQVTGYLVKQDYEEGDPVKTGQVLFEIDPRPFQDALDQAEALLAQQQAQHDNARQTLARVQPLVAQNALSPKDLDDAVAAERSAKAAASAAAAAAEKARLDLGFTRIISPIDGIAGLATADVGDLVGPQAPAGELTTVSTLDPIKVYYNISEQEYIDFAQQGAPKEESFVNAARNWEINLILEDGSVYPRKGGFYALDRQVDVKTGTLRVAASFPNPDYLLRPGQFVRVKVLTGTRSRAILVPQRAVNELQGAFQVAVLDPDNRVMIRSVKPGEHLGGLWLIEDGLKAGEKVVVEGIQKVKDGSQVTPQPYIFKE